MPLYPEFSLGEIGVFEIGSGEDRIIFSGLTNTKGIGASKIHSGSLSSVDILLKGSSAFSFYSDHVNQSGASLKGKSTTLFSSGATSTSPMVSQGEANVAIRSGHILGVIATAEGSTKLYIEATSGSEFKANGKATLRGVAEYAACSKHEILGSVKVAYESGAVITTSFSLKSKGDTVFDSKFKAYTDAASVGIGKLSTVSQTTSNTLYTLIGVASTAPVAYYLNNADLISKGLSSSGWEVDYPLSTEFEILDISKAYFIGGADGEADFKLKGYSKVSAVTLAEGVTDAFVNSRAYVDAFSGKTANIGYAISGQVYCDLASVLILPTSPTITGNAVSDFSSYFLAKSKTNSLGVSRLSATSQAFANSEIHLPGYAGTDFKSSATKTSLLDSTGYTSVTANTSHKAFFCSIFRIKGHSDFRANALGLYRVPSKFGLVGRSRFNVNGQSVVNTVYNFNGYSETDFIRGRQVLPYISPTVRTVLRTEETRREMWK